MNTYIAIDLETTGMRPKEDRIIEIGAIKVVEGKVQERFETFVNPQMSVPVRIQELTGITTKMAKSGLLIEEVIPKLLEFCGDAPLLAHNIMFDYSFIKHKAVNLGMDFEREGIDTLAIARKTLYDLESRRLAALCEYYNIDSGRSHRASDDAVSAHLLYQNLKADFENQAPELFAATPLIHRVKKQGPITKKQKDYLYDLLKYHKIVIDVEIDSLTKNEASRLIDGIILKNGRIMRRRNEEYKS